MCGEKPAALQMALSVTRITPACAGKRLRNLQSAVRTWDHPRMCGEKGASPCQLLIVLGSPPHVRGKAFLNNSPVLRIRITPACAGKSSTCSTTTATTRDHPRMCGEKRMGRRKQKQRDGITPACAGKRLKRSRSIVPHAAIVPLFPSVCNKPAGSDGSPAGHDAPPFLPIENAAPASPAYNLRSL